MPETPPQHHASEHPHRSSASPQSGQSGRLAGAYSTTLPPLGRAFAKTSRRPGNIIFPTMVPTSPYGASTALPWVPQHHRAGGSDPDALYLMNQHIQAHYQVYPHATHPSGRPVWLLPAKLSRFALKRSRYRALATIRIRIKPLKGVQQEPAAEKNLTTAALAQPLRQTSLEALPDTVSTPSGSPSAPTSLPRALRQDVGTPFPSTTLKRTPDWQRKLERVIASPPRWNMPVMVLTLLCAMTYAALQFFQVFVPELSLWPDWLQNGLNATGLHSAFGQWVTLQLAFLFGVSLILGPSQALVCYVGYVLFTVVLGYPLAANGFAGTIIQSPLDTLELTPPAIPLWPTMGYWLGIPLAAMGAGKLLRMQLKRNGRPDSVAILTLMLQTAGWVLVAHAIGIVGIMAYGWIMQWTGDWYLHALLQWSLIPLPVDTILVMLLTGLVRPVRLILSPILY